MMMSNSSNNDSSNNDSNNDSSDCYEFPYLVCCKCNHDMNHPAYRIFKHPDIGTPLCILCHDEVIEVTNRSSNDMIVDDNDNDICTWCKDKDGGTLYICGDGSNCNHSFCEDCINNYPNDNLKQSIECNDMWKCLKCDPILLQPYYDAIELAKKRSWYPYNIDDICIENVEINDDQISDIMNLLKTLLEEEHDTINRLKPKSRAKQYQEILQELKQQYSNDPTIDINDVAANELFTNTTQWQRHLDLIIRQTVDLDEILDLNGFDSNSFIKETIINEEQKEEEEVDEKYMKIVTDLDEIMRKNNNNMDEDLESNNNDFEKNDDDIDIDNYLKQEERLRKLQKRANSDDNVQFFVNNPDKPDLDDNFFPSDFAKLVPKVVLKALYYLGLNSLKGKSLIVPYGISDYPHISLVMKYIDKNFKKNVVQWPSVKHIHPAIINVLRCSDRPADIDLLSKQYNLHDFAAIDDMGDIQEVYQLYQTSGLAYKKKLRIDSLAMDDNDDEMEVRFSLSEVMDAEETERNSEVLSHRQKNQIFSRSCGENDDLLKHKDSLLNRKNYKRKHSDASNSTDNDRTKSVKNVRKKSNKKDDVIIIDIDNDINDDDTTDDNVINDDISNDDISTEYNTKKSPPERPEKKSDTKTSARQNNDDFLLPSANQSYIQDIKNKKNNESINRNMKSNTKPLDSEVIDLVDSDDDDDFVENNPPKKVFSLFGQKNSPIESGNSSKSLSGGFITVTKNDALDRFLNTIDKKEAVRKKVAMLFPRIDPLEDDSGYLILNLKRMKKGDEPIYLMKHFYDAMKQHQKEGLQFIWNNVIDEIDTNPNTKKKGSGCILAHCMGLGKTLTIISFTVAVLASPILDNIKFDPTPATSKSSKSDKKPKDTNKNELGSYFSPLKSDENAESPMPPRNYFFTILIIAPVNTLSNWVNEFNKWCPEVIYRTKRDSYINVSLLAAEDNGMDPHKKLEIRVKKLKKWHTEGGVLIMGYDMFRLLTTEKGESENKKNAANPKLFADIKRYLIDPGPDIVVCDEAHTIKEKKSKITELLCKIVTKRRIALTGSPLQNNLEEYYQMVNWVKPRFLGTLSYFKRFYAQIIAAGENKGAGHSELIAMRKRAYMLHKKLKPIVDRKDLTELEKTLLPKREFSVLIKMSEFQGFMYKTFLARLIEANRGDNSKLIFTAFQALLRVWNHPSIAVINAIQKSNKLAKSNSVSKQTISMKLLEREMEPQVDFFENEGQELSQKLSEDILQIEVNLAQQESSLKSGNDFVDLVDVSDEENDYDEEYDDDYNDVALETQIDDGAEYDDEDESKSPNLQNNLNNVSGDSETHPMDTSKEDDSSIKEVRICDENWWKLKERTIDTPSFEHGEFIKLSNKLVIFLSLLASSINAGDKVLVFTQSVMTLELIECVLKSERWGDVINIQSECSTCKFSQWKEKYHYLRIDGSTSDRQDSIDKFNKLSHIKLFMLSTKAGNMGINLQSANRVVIFDSSWNPAHDLQAIYRAYRYGQTKNVFVYRLLAAGTMEEKIYKKQINKQAMSARIIDAQMPDNHFTMEEKAELLKFTEYKSADFAKVKEALTREPQDHVLMKILESYQSCLHSVDDQTALLEDKDELKLNDQELKEADAELELEERNLGREEREVVPERQQQQQQQQQSTPIVTGDTRIEVPSTVNNNDNTPSSSADSLSDTVKKLISSLSQQDQVLFYQYRRQGISLPEAFDIIRKQGSQK